MARKHERRGSACWQHSIAVHTKRRQPWRGLCRCSPECSNSDRVVLARPQTLCMGLAQSRSAAGHCAEAAALASSGSGGARRQGRTLAPSAGPTGGAGLALPAGSASLIMPVTAGGRGRRQGPAAALAEMRWPLPTRIARSAPPNSPLAAMQVTRRCCWAPLLAAKGRRGAAAACCTLPRKALLSCCCCCAGRRCCRREAGRVPTAREAAILVLLPCSQPLRRRPQLVSRAAWFVPHNACPDGWLFGGGPSTPSWLGMSAPAQLLQPFRGVSHCSHLLQIALAVPAPPEPAPRASQLPLPPACTGGWAVPPAGRWDSRTVIQQPIMLAGATLPLNRRRRRCWHVAAAAPATPPSPAAPSPLRRRPASPPRWMYQRRSSSGGSGPELLGMSVFTAPTKRRGGSGGASRTQALSVLLLLLVALLIFYPQIAAWVTGRGSSSSGGSSAKTGGLAGAGADIGPVLVSYSYFEKDAIQARRVDECMFVVCLLSCCHGCGRRPGVAECCSPSVPCCWACPAGHDSSWPPPGCAMLGMVREPLPPPITHVCCVSCLACSVTTLTSSSPWAWGWAAAWAGGCCAAAAWWGLLHVRGCAAACAAESPAHALAQLLAAQLALWVLLQLIASPPPLHWPLAGCVSTAGPACTPHKPPTPPAACPRPAYSLPTHAHSCPLLLSSPCSPAATDFVVVVNGAVCRPCARLYTLLQESARPLLPPSVITAEYQGEGLAVLKRTENGA